MNKNVDYRVVNEETAEILYKGSKFACLKFAQDLIVLYNPKVINLLIKSNKEQIGCVVNHEVELRI